MDELIAELSEIVKAKTQAWLGSCGVLEVASLTVIQEAMTRVGRAAAEPWEQRGAKGWFS